MTQSTTNYAAFNAVTIQGRVFHAERGTGQYGDFVAVTLISTLSKDGQDVLVTFNDSNGIMSMFDKGFLPKGRMVTVTGHIQGIRETWTDKDGNVNLLQRAEIRLKQAAVLDGGYGMMPKDADSSAPRKGVKVVRPSDAKKDAAAPTDDAPVIDEASAEIF
ncbi:MAG: hypothetical protein CML73_02385 [Rhodobiaceae bacterium]|nr:hypothetical protein [Rhodobiaceae bacterium]